MRDLKEGQRAVITRVNCTGKMKSRLIDMGVTPGAEIAFAKKAPLGDPIEYIILGYRLGMRKSDAEKIEIERLK